MKILISALLLAAYGATGMARESSAAGTPASSSTDQAANAGVAQRKAAGLTVGVNKSFVLDHGTPIRRVSIANGDIAEAVAVSATEILVNGKSPGDTSLVLWDARSERSAFEVHVLPDSSKLDAVRAELSREAGPDASVTIEGSNVFLRGTVKDTITGDRAYAIASTLGKVVNLLRVVVPAVEPQILLKVRFADVDRQAASQLGINIFGGNALKGVGNITTGQFPANPTFNMSGSTLTTTLPDFLNIFYYRPDINVGAVIQALEAKNLLQILAEPNLLATSGHPANFLAGGEFPFPTLQGGASGVGQITIQFKEFGIRLNFLPTVTPRGTIRLTVMPEVSSLDYSNGLTVSGYTVPGLATRRVQTEVELENGQSFVIAGLLNNQVIESLNKIPGLANIPLLGKLFQSRSVQKNNTELLVMVTPELVRAMPSGAKPPEIAMPMQFLKGTAPNAPQTPAITPAPVLPRTQTLPIEELKNQAAAQKNNTNNLIPMNQPSGMQSGMSLGGGTSGSSSQSSSSNPIF